ncbi:response regulator [Kiritimatiella glycovorans]|uniref:Hydrogenase transcriptional regulatory protein hupR1 n=1 Tax=Kiritimatiella glycovorans TaxID=1307763 RepID=A0A0G3EES6_9BACT|nr:response regulator [Kiritimatiella glycovorans]AKJ63892.1 Hydrogenase transcriptional regulatory protein hupR1 [Kiritimatiella glycovorans]
MTESVIGAGVLLVDDEPSVRRLCEKMLRDAWEVRSAGSIAEAETVLEQFSPKVAVCDFKLPDGDGCAFLKMLLERDAKIQRILLTGYTDPEMMRRGINEARLFRMIGKPVSTAELRAAVEYAALEYDILDTAEYVAAEHDRFKQELESWPCRAERWARFLNRSLVQFGRFLVRATALVTVAVGIWIALGFFGIVFLYFMKSWFGVDLLPHAHIENLVRGIMR